MKQMILEIFFESLQTKLSRPCSLCTLWHETTAKANELCINVFIFEIYNCWVCPLFTLFIALIRWKSDQAFFSLPCFRSRRSNELVKNSGCCIWKWFWETTVYWIVCYRFGTQVSWWKLIRPLSRSIENNVWSQARSQVLRSGGEEIHF